MDTLTVCKETLSLRSRRLDGSSGRKRERALARETRKGVRELPLPSRVSSRASGFFLFFFFLVPTTSKCLVGSELNRTQRGQKETRGQIYRLKLLRGIGKYY